MYIQIIKPPPGDAPEEVRRGWVGILLLLAEGDEGPVVAAPAGRLAAPPRAFRVEAAHALDCLAHHDPDAAMWWEKNHPDLLFPGTHLHFPENTCHRIVLK